MTAEVPAAVREQAARMYVRGATIEDVAAQIGQSYRTTRALLLAAGVTIRHGGPLQASDTQRGWNNFGSSVDPRFDKPKLTPQQRDEVRRRTADGETAQALAAEFSVSVHTIYRYR
ncbi:MULTISPECIES: helix-turn-helix domain-containing protein [unclassified Streptomyces]|uniref:helix-turn-helix domain-containing protein n=1 Tax=unclassified Streptomyces TaxID=2593676 RepID=UPI00055AC94B|nr:MULTISPECIES: helix-turn-helix domain-containing protein [unclassified Streptomyces]KOV86100.1 hypothetical protein ADL02_19625 [Streptomyces sp. NRRL WC-3723]